MEKIKTKVAVGIILTVALILGGLIWWKVRKQRQSNVSTSAAQNAAFPTRSQQNSKNDQPSVANKSELNLAVEDAAIPMITDSDGRSTGFYLKTNRLLQEIPRSVYFEDSLGGPAKAGSRFIYITQPQSGKYTITLTTLRAVNYHLSISAFSSDGKPQPGIVQKGHLTRGAQIKYVLYYSSTPGAVSSLTASPN